MTNWLVKTFIRDAGMGRTPPSGSGMGSSPESWASSSICASRRGNSWPASSPGASPSRQTPSTTSPTRAPRSVTLLGFKLAAQKPDSHHPFGHGRMEYVSGLVVSMVILLMGIELGKTSIEKILRPEEVTFSPVVVGDPDRLHCREAVHGRL